MLKGFKHCLKLPAKFVLMKQTIKIYLEQKDITRLKEKASQHGCNGKGAISHYIERISRESVIFLDENVMALIKSLKVKK